MYLITALKETDVCKKACTSCKFFKYNNEVYARLNVPPGKNYYWQINTMSDSRKIAVFDTVTVISRLCHRSSAFCLP